VVVDGDGDKSATAWFCFREKGRERYDLQLVQPGSIITGQLNGSAAKKGESNKKPPAECRGRVCESGTLVAVERRYEKENRIQFDQTPWVLARVTSFTAESPSESAILRAF
jgi:hypothetical protein